jgi:hypothetical protein
VPERLSELQNGAIPDVRAILRAIRRLVLLLLVVGSPTASAQAPGRSALPAAVAERPAQSEIGERAAAEARHPLDPLEPDEEPAVDRGKRLTRALCWVRSEPTDNGYARPIEGVVVIVDLNRKVAYDGRPIMYRGSIAEMVVPYADPKESSRIPAAMVSPNGRRPTAMSPRPTSSCGTHSAKRTFLVSRTGR